MIGEMSVGVNGISASTQSVAQAVERLRLTAAGPLQARVALRTAGYVVAWGRAAEVGVDAAVNAAHE